MVQTLPQPAAIDPHHAGLHHAAIVKPHTARLEGVRQTRRSLRHHVQKPHVAQGHGHLAGIDLRHVQHVVDRPCQFLRRALDRIQIGLVLGVLTGILRMQQVGIADNRRQRRAQFVRHIGDEIALQPHRFIQRIVARHDGLFQAARRGDVGKRHQGRPVRQGLGPPLRQPAIRDFDFTQLWRPGQRIGIGHPRLEFRPETAIMHQRQA